MADPFRFADERQIISGSLVSLTCRWKPKQGDSKMRKILSAAGVAAIMFAAVPAVHAKDALILKRVGPWDIGVDESLDYGCFMITRFSRGTVFAIGFDRKTGNNYVIAGNDAWHLEAGKEYPLDIQFDNEPSYHGTAIAVGKPMLLYLPFDKPKFVADFARKQTVSIAYRGRSVTTLPLDSTYEATLDLLACQEAVERSRNGSRSDDPFRTDRPRPRNDPYSNSPARADPVSDPFSP